MKKDKSGLETDQETPKVDPLERHRFSDPDPEVMKIFSGNVMPRKFFDSMTAEGQRPPHVRSGVEKTMQNSYTIKKKLSAMWKMTKSELRSMIEDEDTEMGDIALASILVAAAKEGDPVKLQFVLDRMVGKVKIAHEKIEEDENLRNIPTEKLIALLDDLPKIIDA